MSDSAKVMQPVKDMQPVENKQPVKDMQPVLTCGAQDRPPRDLSSWDRAPLEEWVRRLGADRIGGVLVKLRDQLRVLAVLVAKDGGLDGDLERLAHDAASTAGMLGFSEVTRCCRALSEPGVSLQDARPRLAEALHGAIRDLDWYLATHESKVAA